MARHNFREIVLMVLAVLGGLAIVLLIGTRLTQVVANAIPPGDHGIVFSIGGVSRKQFAMVIAALVGIVVLLAAFPWRR